MCEAHREVRTPRHGSFEAQPRLERPELLGSAVLTRRLLEHALERSRERLLAPEADGHGNVEHRPVREDEHLRGLGKPAAADVVAHGHAGIPAKASVQVVLGVVGRTRDFGQAEPVRKVLLDILHR